MMERVFDIVGLEPSPKNVNLHDTSASLECIFDNDPHGKPRLQSWIYRLDVGSLSYIQAIIRPNMTIATQLCARFCNNPSQEHEEVVKRICRYL